MSTAPPPPPPADPRASVAAVAMVFSPSPTGAGVELLMIRRAEHPGDPWSGQMAFPGGRFDPIDASPLETAARETLEEVGLPLPDAARLGPLAPIQLPVRIQRDPLIIHPFVYAFEAPLPALIPDPSEVAGLHRFAWSRLLAGEGRAVFPWRFRGQPIKMPCVLIDGCRIWGLSLKMIDDLIVRVRAHAP